MYVLLQKVLITSIINTLYYHPKVRCSHDKLRILYVLHASMKFQFSFREFCIHILENFVLVLVF